MIVKIDKTIVPFISKTVGKNIPDVLLRCNSLGITVKQACIQKHRYIHGNLSSKHTSLIDWDSSQFNDDILLAITETDKFLKILSSFDDMITMTIEGNSVVLSSTNRSARYLLVDPNYIKNIETEGSKRLFEEDSSSILSVKLPMKFFDKIRGDISLLGAQQITFIIEDKKIKFVIGSKNENAFTELFDIESDVKINAIYNAQFLSEIISSITTEEVELSVRQLTRQDESSFHVLRFKEETENWFFKNYLAPIENIQ